MLSIWHWTDQFKLVNKLEIMKLSMNYFTHLVVSLQQILLRLITPSKLPEISMSQFKDCSNRSKMHKLSPMCRTWIWLTLSHNVFVINNTINIGVCYNELHDLYCQCNTYEIDFCTLKNCATAWTEQEHHQCSSRTKTYVNIAKDDDSISIFNKAVANLAVLHMHLRSIVYHAWAVDISLLMVLSTIVAEQSKAIKLIIDNHDSSTKLWQFAEGNRRSNAWRLAWSWVLNPESLVQR